MVLAREWDDLVTHVRAMPGFEDFLRPPRLENLLPVARSGPVVVVNVSRWRCDAIIARDSGTEVVTLPDLTANEVARHADAYLRALLTVEQATQALFLARRRFDDGDRSRDATAAYDVAKRAYAFARRDMESGLTDVTAWLWDAVGEPVLTALGFTTTRPDPPRLWWCPTGLLSLLPLHAAGRHDTGDGHTVLDRVVSSYTPTLRALREASQDSEPTGRRMLVVALPNMPGQVPLPAVTRERDLLTRVFAGCHTLLEGADANWEAVRAQVPNHAWVHFSCHGDQDLADPSRGGLLLYDRTLTIGDVGTTEYRGEFAFLSACKTATGGLALADEVITLAAALHYTGYRHVIGTLWSVHDTMAATVAESVYTDLTVNGTFEPARSAHALHAAIRRIRDESDGRLSTWMPFTHTGP